MKQLLLDIQPAPTPSFKNFVIGRNAEVINSLTTLLHGQNPQRFIYLWGEKGSGKTHLLKAAQLAQTQQLTCVDDAHTLDDAAQIHLFNTYNDIRHGEGMLLVTGNAAPTQMHLRDDLATRLAWGLVYQLHPLTDAEKAMALKNHATARGMKLPDEVLDYCLRYLRRDLPTLMNTLNALDEWSLTYKRPVTVPLLRQLLALPLSPHQ